MGNVADQAVDGFAVNDRVGTRPLTHYLGSAQTRPRRKREKGAQASFPGNRIIRQISGRFH
ncbi:hypothetical protein, partial [Sporofaciens musculi]|uniref:hypothetical protein n=1 Tax=Sporofaciens musculi TaxID=2681861 RepID=UPI0025707643